MLVPGRVEAIQGPGGSESFRDLVIDSGSLDQAIGAGARPPASRRICCGRRARSNAAGMGLQ
jgi:hypothetical protein